MTYAAESIPDDPKLASPVFQVKFFLLHALTPLAWLGWSFVAQRDLRVHGNNVLYTRRLGYAMIARVMPTQILIA